MKSNLKNKKFYIECDFTVWTEVGENMLNNMVSKNMDIIPGLKAKAIILDEELNNKKNTTSDISSDVLHLRNQIVGVLDKMVEKYSDGNKLKQVNTSNGYAKELANMASAEAVRHTENILNNRNSLSKQLIKTDDSNGWHDYTDVPSNDFFN